MNLKGAFTPGLVLSLALWGLGIGTGFAAGKPTPVTVTIRSTANLPLGPFDVVHGDGAGHAATMDTNGPALTYFYATGEVSYDLGVDNVYSGEACPAGQFTGTVTGSGNLKVTLDTGTWLLMLAGESRPGTMQFGLEGYLLRFLPVDGLGGTPNCSTQVTITRQSSSVWTVESDSNSIARLLQGSTPRGNRVVWTSLGHYKPAVFMMTITNP